MTTDKTVEALAEAWVVDAIHAALAAHTGKVTEAKPDQRKAEFVAALRAALAEHDAQQCETEPTNTREQLL
jgi:hypothetical protein